MIVNDTRSYHTTKAPNMDTEISVALLLTVNHDLLKSQQSYGRALCNQFYQRWYVSSPWEYEKGWMDVAEVGPGLGFATYDFLVDLMHAHDQPFRYTAIDLSPQLISVSRQLFDELGVLCNSVSGDAHQIRTLLPENSVDMFIANEVAGDLLTLDEIPPEWLSGTAPSHQEAGDSLRYLGQLRGLLKRHKVPVYWHNRVAYNLGAMQLIEDLYPILRRGGLAFMSEYSCEQPVPAYDTLGRPLLAPPRDVPTPVKLGSGDDTHTEYSVRFSDLEAVAKSVGFETERGKLPELVGIREDARQLPLSFMGDLLKSLGIQPQDFARLAEQHSDVFPGQIKGNPRFVQMYLSCHPELFKPLLSMGDDEYEYRVGRRLFYMRDVEDSFEYLILLKPVTK